MAQHVKVWYDAEGDFLEVLFSDEPGYMRATANDAVMERVSQSGELLGFSVMNARRASQCNPLVAELVGVVPENG